MHVFVDCMYQINRVKSWWFLGKYGGYLRHRSLFCLKILVWSFFHSSENIFVWAWGATWWDPATLCSTPSPTVPGCSLLMWQPSGLAKTQAKTWAKPGGVGLRYFNPHHGVWVAITACGAIWLFGAWCPGAICSVINTGFTGTCVKSL